MNLRQKKPSFSGFTTGEVEKMEQLLKDNDEKSLDLEFCKKLASAFNHSKGRAGKPIVKWTEVQKWFQTKGADGAECAEEGAAETAQIFRAVREACSLNRKRGLAKGENDSKLLKMDFEAKSSKDNAWYDVEKFVGHRHLNSPDTNLGAVLVRFSGFQKDQDEWLQVKNAVRQRSIRLEDCECQLVKVGDIALYYQEEKAEARFFEVKISSIKKRVHDVRGCRCKFTIQYIDGNNIKKKAKKVQLKSLCFRPSILDSKAM